MHVENKRTRLSTMNFYLAVLGISTCIVGILGADYNYDQQKELGSSKLCPVTLEYRPVCGSDGVTYDNPSSLACAARDKPGLKQEYTGSCSSYRTSTTTSRTTTSRYRPTTTRRSTTRRPTTSRYTTSSYRTSPTRRTTRWPEFTDRTSTRFPEFTDRTTARWRVITDRTSARWPVITDRTTSRWPVITDRTTSRWPGTDSTYVWPGTSTRRPYTTTRRVITLPTRTPYWAGSNYSSGGSGGTNEVVDLNRPDESGYKGGSKIGTGDYKGGYLKQYRQSEYRKRRST